MGITIVAAAPRDVDTIARVLGEAFRADPHLRGLLTSGDDRDAQERLTRLYRMLVGHHLRSRQPLDLAVEDGQVLDAAVWSPPGRNHARIGPRDLLTLVRVFGRRLPDAGRESSSVAAVRPGDPHWYLAAIGTAVPAQGRGMGRAMIEPGLARADRDGHGCHLEAATRDLVPLYEGFGFLDRGDIASPTPAHAVAMWRPVP